MSTPDSAPNAEPRRVLWADALPQPWRNGGGITRELLTWPAGPDWQLRLSVADIQADGPFSVFEGVQRWCVVLDGAGVTLTINGQMQQQTPSSAPLNFSGDVLTDCRLIAGASRDLNLMLRGCAGGLAPVVPGQAWSSDTACCGLFAADAGQCTAQDRPYAVPAMSLLWFDAPPGPLIFTGPAAALTRAWWIWAAPARNANLGPGDTTA
jgi:hypothetical protein